MKIEEPVIAETKKKYLDPLHIKSTDENNDIKYIDDNKSYSAMSVSRYFPYRRYIDSNGQIVYESYNQKFIEKKDSDKYYRVELDNENRLDKISLTYYNNSQYWWIIAIANNIIDPFSEVEYDTVIRIPSLQAVHEQRGIINAIK